VSGIEKIWGALVALSQSPWTAVITWTAVIIGILCWLIPSPVGYRRRKQDRVELKEIRIELRALREALQDAKISQAAKNEIVNVAESKAEAERAQAISVMTGGWFGRWGGANQTSRPPGTIRIMPRPGEGRAKS
jgi:hypothetical protein